MDEKKHLIFLLDFLHSEDIIALQQIVYAMIYPRYDQENLTAEEESRLNDAIKEVEQGEVVSSNNLDDLFK